MFKAKITFIIYQIILMLITPALLFVFIYRIAIDKDNFTSVMQRFGLKKPLRKKGQYLWIHAASVGEAKLAINLIQKLENMGYNFLVTTGTLSSSIIIRKQLPFIEHQFTPIDNFFIVRNFLKYWNISKAIFIESELWPTLLSESSKQFPLILANARLSNKSFIKWQKNKEVFQFIVNNFQLILTSSENDLEKYKNLGVDNIENFGNMKFSDNKLTVNQDDYLRYKNNIGKKNILFLASTHKADEEILLPALQDLDLENCFIIMALRHPHRGIEVEKNCIKMGFKAQLYSKNNILDAQTNMLIIDVFGLIGLGYKLADVSYIGGSFDRGGHNLLEATHFDTAIICGADMSNYQEIADEMLKENALIKITNSEEFKTAFKKILPKNEKKLQKGLSVAAKNYIMGRKGVFDTYVNYIKRFIEL